MDFDASGSTGGYSWTGFDDGLGGGCTYSQWPNTITSYGWDFGDGATEATSNYLTSHQYASAGSYLVTLTVTSSGFPPDNTSTTSKSVTVAEDPPPSPPPLTGTPPATTTNTAAKKRCKKGRRLKRGKCVRKKKK